MSLKVSGKRLTCGDDVCGGVVPSGVGCGGWWEEKEKEETKEEEKGEGRREKGEEKKEEENEKERNERIEKGT